MAAKLGEANMATKPKTAGKWFCFKLCLNIQLLLNGLTAFKYFNISF
jgi:hypothetical protein